MFERYTEKARRTIFFARYEASQFGSNYIEAEHLLLGLLREDKALISYLVRRPKLTESIRAEIEGHLPVREKISTMVELPLSVEAKRVLTYAAEEGERLGDRYIGTEHLILGLLREEGCFAARTLSERGVRLSSARDAIGRRPEVSLRPKPASLLDEYSSDLTEAALETHVDPVIGRESELERVVQILCRRINNNPVLIGEPGVGKTAIVQGLAQSIADGDVPSFLADKRILELDLAQLVAGTKYRGQYEERVIAVMKELVESQETIIFVDELQMLVGAGPAEASHDTAAVLKPALLHGDIRCITETTPGGYRKSIEKAPWFANCSQVVNVVPIHAGDAIKVLASVKERFEEFHSVNYTNDALEAAVEYSERFVPDRYLPTKAVDLIDEAGSRVKLRRSILPKDIVEAKKRIKFITHRLERAIASHDFERARLYSDEERKEGEILRELTEKYNLDEVAMSDVSRKDIEDVVAGWPRVPKDFATANSSRFYSCFISYSSKDQEFAEHLRAELLAKGVRCWFAAEDLKIGDKFRTRIDESIRSYDKLLLVLSAESIQSPWVEDEVEAASERERQQREAVLFPIRLDDSVMECPQAWASSIRRERHIGDFRNWRIADVFEKAFERLLRDLKSEEETFGG